LTLLEDSRAHWIGSFCRFFFSLPEFESHFHTAALSRFATISIHAPCALMMHDWLNWTGFELAVLATD
jgi:hypothetical protein